MKPLYKPQLLKIFLLSMIMIFAFIAGTHAQSFTSNDDEVPVYRWYSSSSNGFADVAYYHGMDSDMRRRGFDTRRYLFTGFKYEGNDRELLFQWTMDGEYYLSMTLRDAKNYLNEDWKRGNEICYVRKTQNCIGCVSIALLAERNGGNGLNEVFSNWISMSRNVKVNALP